MISLERLSHRYYQGQYDSSTPRHQKSGQEHKFPRAEQTLEAVGSGSDITGSQLSHDITTTRDDPKVQAITKRKLLSCRNRIKMKRRVVCGRIDPLTQSLKQLPSVLSSIFAPHHRHNQRTQLSAYLRHLWRSFRVNSRVRRTRIGTHLLYERLQHSPTITHVATETRASRVRFARELYRARQVNAIIPDRQPGPIKSRAARATNIHHDATWFTIRTMRDLVFVEETQALVYVQHRRPPVGRLMKRGSVPQAPGGCSR